MKAIGEGPSNTIQPISLINPELVPKNWSKNAVWLVEKSFAQLLAGPVNESTTDKAFRKHVVG